MLQTVVLWISGGFIAFVALLHVVGKVSIARLCSCHKAPLSCSEGFLNVVPLFEHVIEASLAR